MIVVSTGAPGDNPGAHGSAETSDNFKERAFLVLALADIVRQFDPFSQIILWPCLHGFAHGSRVSLDDACC